MKEMNDERELLHLFAQNWFKMLSTPFWGDFMKIAIFAPKSPLWRGLGLLNGDFGALWGCLERVVGTRVIFDHTISTTVACTSATRQSSTKPGDAAAAQVRAGAANATIITTGTIFFKKNVRTDSSPSNRHRTSDTSRTSCFVSRWINFKPNKISKCEKSTCLVSI